MTDQEPTVAGVPLDFASFLSARREAAREADPTEGAIEVVLLDLDELGRNLAAMPVDEDEDEARAAAERVLHFAPSSPPGPWIEGVVRRQAGLMLSNSEFFARWYSSVLPADEWAWLSQQIINHPAVWDDDALMKVYEGVLVEQVARPTTPRSSSRSTQRKSGRGSSGSKARSGSRR